MTQADRAALFASLHKPGEPLVLYNIWDAGSAKAVADAGAKALATGSWSVAGAQGFADGEQIPLSFLTRIAGRIAATVDLPLSVDFEGCYAVPPNEVAGNVRAVIDAGAVGINFEDQVVGGDGLHETGAQAERIAAARAAAEGLGLPLFINARTDLFLKEKDAAKHGGLMDEAKARVAAYAEAGASGFFAPGLIDAALIGQICEASPLPVNVIVRKGLPETAELASLGVARISHGPGPWVEAMAAVKARAEAALG